MGSFLCALLTIHDHSTTRRPKVYFLCLVHLETFTASFKAKSKASSQKCGWHSLRRKRVWSLKQSSLILLHRSERKYLLAIFHEDTSFSDVLNHLFQNNSNNNKRSSMLEHIELYLQFYLYCVYNLTFWLSSLN